MQDGLLCVLCMHKCALAHAAWYLTWNIADFDMLQAGG